MRCPKVPSERPWPTFSTNTPSSTTFFSGREDRTGQQPDRELHLPHGHRQEELPVLWLPQGRTGCGHDVLFLRHLQDARHQPQGMAGRYLTEDTRPQHTKTGGTIARISAKSRGVVARMLTS